MLYLIVQTWLFLGIAWLVGIVIGFLLAKDQKSRGHKEAEAELQEARDRGIARDKEIDEFRLRVAELEGLPEGARASRVAARDEMVARMTHLERELETARTSEKRLSDEAERLRNDVDGFRTRYLEARAKWDEYQTKAEALAAAPQPMPLNLGEAQMMPDDTMRQKVMELEGQLSETVRTRDKALDQLQALSQRVREMETQTSTAGAGGSGDAKALKARVAELEGRLASGFASARETDALKSRVADLQDKLSEAEVALSKAISSTKAAGAEPLKARISELEGQLAQARAATTVVEVAKSDGDSSRLKARIAEVEGKLTEAQRQVGEAQTLRTRMSDLEQQLDKAKRQANEAQALRQQIQSLEARLAAQPAVDERTSGGEDVSLLKARLADVENRLMSSSQSSVEFESLRNRVMSLEALLHEAAKSRDEAAILRSKVAELDGRLGQALKAAAEKV